jgi:hypothetical protein
MQCKSTTQYMISTLEKSTYGTCSVRTSKGTQNYLRYLLILYTLAIHRERVSAKPYPSSILYYTYANVSMNTPQGKCVVIDLSGSNRGPIAAVLLTLLEALVGYAGYVI